MIIDDVATQANSLLIHHPDAITDFNLFKKRQNIKPNRAIKPTKDNANGENNLIGCFRSDRNKRNIGNGYFS